MHDLLEELGKTIVQENSNLWDKKQVDYVMMEKMEKHVEAIVFNHDDDEDDEYVEKMVMIAEHLSKMRHLRLIIIKCPTTSGSLTCLSNKLRYIDWPDYPFKYLPSSFQPNQLVELSLQNSSIEQLWKGKKYLPNLRHLDLNHSINLIKMPHFGEFPNLEWLDLEGCIRLVQLDPSIGLLTKLVYLNLKDCENIRHLGISASHSQSTTSSILKRTMLHGLRELDLSFCSLVQIPDTIGCMYWLQGLNLGGNNFVTVPSLGELSKLEYLNLEHCKLLKSLPKLPSPTCIEHSLYKNSLLALETRWCNGLLIFNCPNLGEREHCCTKMTFSWMIQFIQANPHSSPNPLDVIQIVTPGSEIPSWFRHQSKGDWIRIDRSPIMHDNNNNIIGCVCCVVFSMAPQFGSRKYQIRLIFTADICRQKSTKSGTIIPVNLYGSLITVKSNHIWLTYFPLESSWDVLNETLYVEMERGEDLGIEVKNCGYHWVYKEDLQEFNLTKMNHRNSIGGKRKSLAIEDQEAQPQPKLHSFI